MRGERRLLIQSYRCTRDHQESAAQQRPEHDGLSVALPDEIVEAVARRAADLVREHTTVGPERWIGVTAAAEHLACPRSRIYALVSARRIPHRKDGSRLLFRRTELDEWLEQGGAVRP